MGLGDSCMDISVNLNKVLRFLIKKKLGPSSVFIHNPSQATLGKFIVVLNIQYNNKKLKASASAENKYLAFVKAMSEMGEEIICEDMNYATRAGIAGGFIKNEVITRAKSELIEHDAFLYHYRNKIPFNFIDVRESKHKTLKIYALYSFEKIFHTILVTDDDSINNNESCIMFATSTHTDHKIAVEKAITEYTQIYLNHYLWADHCHKLCKGEIKPEKKTDLHHIASRDKRNKIIFKNLCINSTNVKYSRFETNVNWIITKTESPIKLVHFFRLQNQKLLKMEFGIPEKGYEAPPQLLHPFW